MRSEYDRFGGTEDCSERICAGCDVNEPWEHRCCGGDCECERCRESDVFAERLRNAATPEEKDELLAEALSR